MNAPTVLAVLALVLIALNAAGIGLGAGIGFSLRLARTEDVMALMQRNTTLLDAGFHTVQAALLGAFATNVSAITPRVTVIQNGTYTMTLLGSEEDHDTTGTYTMQNVELADDLSFTLLIIDSPETPATWDTFGNGGTYYAIVRYFEPLVTSYRSNTGVRQSFTPANRARLVITGSPNVTTVNPTVQFGNVLNEGISLYFDFASEAGSDVSEPNTVTLTFSSPLQVLVPTL